MRILLVAVAVLGWALLAAENLTNSLAGDTEISAERLLAAKDDELEKLVTSLRDRQDEGLANALKIRDDFEVALLARGNNQPDATANEQLARLNAIVDQVAGQRDAVSSRLFWHTDLERAIVAAKRQNKPILSLRLLGKLTDEFSCANSRFFRTTLYPDETLGNLLRNGFVLHWETVYNAPQITIDFGDGRVLRRTITGNSAHLVLTADGQPVDVLPGLYDAETFRELATAAGGIATRVQTRPVAERAGTLKQWHQERLTKSMTTWNHALAALPKSVARPEESRSVSELSLERHEAFWREMASRTAMPKSLDPFVPVAFPARVEAMIRKENPAAPVAGRLAVTKARIEDPVLRMIRNLVDTIALDTVRNEFVLHHHVHEWFVGGNVQPDARQLTDRVYAELFLMPRHDPWLGLAPPDVYTGLKNAGLDTSSVARGKN